MVRRFDSGRERIPPQEQRCSSGCGLNYQRLREDLLSSPGEKNEDKDSSGRLLVFRGMCVRLRDGENMYICHKHALLVQYQ